MNIAYSSPLKLFPDLTGGVDIADASFLNGLKRRMLAEFQLNDEKPLLIDGRHYSKDDVLQLIDRLRDENTFGFHLRIWNDKSLLDFLEKSIIPTSADSWEDYKNDERFIFFISPYFSETYNSLLADRFKKSDHDALRTLVQLPLLVSSSDELKLYAHTQRTVHSLLKELRVVIELLNEKAFKEKPATLKKYYHKGFIDCLNMLPMLFMGMRNQLATELINLYVQVYNSLKRPDLAQEVIQHGARLSVEPYERSLLDERIEEIKRLRKGDSPESSDNNVWVVLKIIGVVVYILIMIARGCGNNNSSSSVDINKIPKLNIDIPEPNPADLWGKTLPEEINEAILNGISLERIRNFHNVNKVYTSSRPPTGKEVMLGQQATSSAVLSDTSRNGARKGSLMVVNKSAQDCVVMLARGRAYNHYLRKNDSLLFSNLETGAGQVFLYQGEEWYPNASYIAIGASDTVRRYGMFDAYASIVGVVEKIKIYASPDSNSRIVITKPKAYLENASISDLTRKKMISRDRVVECN